MPRGRGNRGGAGDRGRNKHLPRAEAEGQGVLVVVAAAAAEAPVIEANPALQAHHTNKLVTSLLAPRMKKNSRGALEGRRARRAIAAALAILLAVAVAALLRLFFARPGWRMAKAAGDAEAMDLQGPWDLDVTQALTVSRISAERMQVDENVDATGLELEAGSIVAGTINTPRDYSPSEPEDMATFKYLWGLAAAGGNLPRGLIIYWAEADRGPGAQWILCDGEPRTLADGTVLTPPDLRGRMIKGAGSVAEAGKTGGRASVELTEAQMPEHNHGETGDPAWPDGEQARETSLAGEHNHEMVQYGFCGQRTRRPGTTARIGGSDGYSYSGWANFCAPGATTRTVPFYMRTARRTGTGTVSAYTTLDEVTVNGTKMATTVTPSGFEFDSRSHTHSLDLKHTHAMNSAGSGGALLTVPGRTYVGHYMRV